MMRRDRALRKRAHAHDQPRRVSMTVRPDGPWGAAVQISHVSTQRFERESLD